MEWNIAGRAERLRRWLLACRLKGPGRVPAACPRGEKTIATRGIGHKIGAMPHL